MRRATARQIEAALDTLATVSETEDINGSARDDIGRVRHTLYGILDARGVAT